MRGYAHDLFTPDAWEGMRRLSEYSTYVEGVAGGPHGLEREAGCEQCRANRMVLERAWQTVANEYYSPMQRQGFSQARWAAQLLTTLKESGGALRTRAELHAAISRMLAALGDRYTQFLEPSAFRRALRRPAPAERLYLEAQYVGVGIQFGGLSPVGGRIVEAPLGGSPAEAAGIVRGDRIMEMEGIPAEALTLGETSSLLRGPAGSSVELAVAASAGGAPVRRMVLERRPLPQPAVQEARLAMPGGSSVSVIRLHYFSSEARRGVARALQRGESDGVAGFVLDLRNDPGGVFEEAVAIAGLVLDPRAVVAETVRSAGGAIDATWSRSNLAPELSALPAGVTGVPVTQRPLVVLLNSASASSSEVLAGALRDYGRAVLVGERSFGKGVIQYYFPLEDGSGLKITVAKYLSPVRHYDVAREGGHAPDVHCTDYPHGAPFARGAADRCLLSAMQIIAGQTGESYGRNRGAGQLPGHLASGAGTQVLGVMAEDSA